jgi:hypothetical protein
VGLFDRIWKAWGNMYRGRSEDGERQQAADAAENQNISRGWPTDEQQSAADAAEDENIGSYSGGEGGEEPDGEGGAEPGAEAGSSCVGTVCHRDYAYVVRPTAGPRFATTLGSTTLMPQCASRAAVGASAEYE